MSDPVRIMSKFNNFMVDYKHFREFSTITFYKPNPPSIMGMGGHTLEKLVLTNEEIAELMMLLKEVLTKSKELDDVFKLTE